MHDISIWGFLFRYLDYLSGWEIKWLRFKTSLRGQLLSSYVCLLPHSRSAPVTWPLQHSSYLCWPQWWVHWQWRRKWFRQLRWSSSIVYFMLTWIFPLECSIETSPSRSWPVSPCLVTRWVGHSSWISWVPFPGPLLPLIFCQTHQFSNRGLKRCPPHCSWRMASVC